MLQIESFSWIESSLHNLLRCVAGWNIKFASTKQKEERSSKINSESWRFLWFQQLARFWANMSFVVYAFAIFINKFYMTRRKQHE